MRSKRLLTMLLVVCLVASLLSPAAFAISAGEDNYVPSTENTETVVADKAETSAKNGLLATENGVAVNTMRDSDGLKVAVKGNGNWSAEESDSVPTVSLLNEEIPACVEEIKAVAELYDANEIVSAFVVMEGAAMADATTSRSLISASMEAQMIEKQNNVIAAIERTVLNGAELEVRYQFTYLTNSFTIRTEFANLEKIAMMEGVKSVFITPVYDVASVADPNTAASGAMTGVADVWENLGYTGTGMKIAIIDTGLDLDHPSFAADPELGDTSMTMDDIADVLELLNAYKYRSSVTAADLYRSAKVPYAFNYVDANLTADHSADLAGDHGTHVAGIAAANAVEGTTVVGMAPDAQIIVMKVFGANGGAYMDDIVAALEDAMTLGCDVVNASLGTSAGFSVSGSEEMDLIYERIAAQDTAVFFSAGNDGTSSYANMWGTDLNRTQNPDNAAVGSPSTFANVMSVASAENSEVMTNYLSAADGSIIFYQDSMEGLYAEAGYEDYYGAAYMKMLVGTEYEYVVIEGLGEEEYFYDAEGNSLVEGKIAIVKRGEISFAEKIYNAEMAGAAAVIIWNQNDDDDIFNFGMTTAYGEGVFPGIPSCIVTLSDGQILVDAETKTLSVAEDQAARQCEGGQMSSFSSWGASPDLRLLPDITGIGGNVYSCYDGGIYGLMSGTSMSSPQLAGICALVMQHLYTIYPNSPNGTIREMAEAIIMSTADPIISNESEVEASPRQQGAGLVDAYEATTATAYLTVGGGRPKAELGDSAYGTYSFSFEIHNISDEAKTYTLSSSLLTEGVTGMWVSATEAEYFMLGQEWPMDGTVTFSKDTVTVPADGIAYVGVTIELSAEEMAFLDAYWENGAYVEGYVYLSNEEGAVELNLPFMGFYGDWTDAPIFDTAYWYDNTFWGVAPANGLPEGDEYYHVFWTDLDGTDWILGFNAYSGAMVDDNGNIIYDPANNIISPNGDGVLDGISEIYLSLLRNAKTLTFTYTVDGEIVHRETITEARKTMYLSNYGQVVPWLYSWYGMNLYDFTDAEGNYLANGTEVLLTIDATVDYGLGGNHSIQIPFTIDTERPELLGVYELPQEDGSQYLAVRASDNTSLASIVLLNKSGTRVYDQVFDTFGTVEQDDGSYIGIFDITGLGTEFTVAVCDYGCNEAYYDVTYTAADDGNLPEMDTTKLYAYRVYDNYIYSDHMYGWVSMNKPASADEYANITVHTDDYLEYAAINAAEFAGGKIFAVDAVYNLIVMDPGLFDRNTITNLGVNVIDMTFDDSTDTMYVLTKDEGYVSLCTMDLLTGELTELKDYGYYYYAPQAITDDDNGTIYAIKYSYSSYNTSYLYTLDADNGYAMTEVMNGDAAVALTDSYGNNLAPNYAQSMAYADGVIYLAYIYYAYYGEVTELICINTADWSFFSSIYAAQARNNNNELVDYYPSTELVGLLTLDETDYQIPEADAVVSISLDAEQIIISGGQSEDLSVSCLPWNYNLDKTQLVWTSSNETVATVENGTVTGVGEGVATITVAYGDLEASCKVIVVNIGGSFYTYNYYSADGYYGYMIEVDMESMDYFLVGDLSPVDFMAGDYNGHDGYFYGYDMGGQLYRYDINTNEATPLGASIGTYPVDMAYDYSTGMMYALVLNYNTYENTLYAVNMSNGGVMEVATGMGLMTFAISDDGTMYAMDASGYLNQIIIEDYSMYGMGNYMSAMPVLEEPFGELYLLQSMCWDHNNDVLLWNWCENASIVWIDVENGYFVNLGDPTESGVCEFTGMFTVPEVINELPDTAVESVTAEDMLILTGYEKVPTITVAPFNATCQNLVLSSGNPEVVAVTENGTLLGVSAGTATVTATLEDSVGGSNYEVSFNVTVLAGADHMYAHLLSDVATYDAQAWIQLYPGNPGQYDVLNYFDYTIFTAEYVDGKIYTYGYDAMDWEANQQFFILNASSYAIETQVDMGEAFPFVYDMTYDYATGAMYLLAGAAEDDTQLYVMDMETGEIVLLMDVEPLLLAIAAGPDGKLYAIENSSEVYDEWDPWAAPVLGNAQLHAIDPVAGTIEWVGDTGLQSNMISSMAYDYDTDAMYWTAFAQTTSYISNLAIVDLETGAAASLGTIGTAGAQVGGLHFVCDEYPETDTSVLQNVLMSDSKLSMNVGETASAGIIIMPGSLNASVRWTSSDRNVATVDSNGTITGVAQGKATITATVTYKGTTMSASCEVAVLDADACFLTYNVTDGGWAEINRGDYTVVTNLTEGAEETAVAAIVSVGETVYGYDVDGQLFQLNTETYERINIGEGLGLEVDENSLANIKDMAYDSANDRVLVLIDTLVWDDDWAEYSEVYNGCALYVVDLESGALEQLFVFEDYSYVYAISADNAGNVFFYNTFNDDVCKYNTQTGEITKIVSLQTQSIYGDMYCDYSMHYDSLTDTIYMLHTSNGNFYKMITIDPVTGTLTENGYVGEVVRDGWYNIGDVFNGLTFVYVESDVPADPDPIEPEEPSIPSGPIAPGGSDEDEEPADPEDGEDGDDVVVESNFSDVVEGGYYYDAVQWAVENGITTGTSETTFSPGSVCTRAQVVTFLWRAAGSPTVEAENPFTDVVEGQYYYDAVLWAVENGITNGTSETTFSPDVTCTRAQVVTFLWRAAGSPAVEAANPFTDVADGEYYYTAVLWAVENGITNGVSADQFAPAANCIRAEIVTFIYRAHN